MNSITRFEIIADLYYKRHGRLAPGKSEPIESSRNSNDEENRAQWDNWFATSAFKDAIARITELETYINELEDSHQQSTKNP